MSVQSLAAARARREQQQRASREAFLLELQNPTPPAESEPADEFTPPAPRVFIPPSPRTTETKSKTIEKMLLDITPADISKAASYLEMECPPCLERDTLLDLLARADAFILLHRAEQVDMFAAPQPEQPAPVSWEAAQAAHKEEKRKRAARRGANELVI